MKCSKSGCLAKATKVPVLCVPRKGIPLDLQRPIKATIDIPCCDRHIGEPTVRDLLSPAMRRLFTAQTLATTITNPPDFDRAYIEPVSMDSIRYEDAMRQKKARGLLV